MANRILTLRELNRATLARQMLLERQTLPVPAAMERLAGLQAQLPMPPYVGLWTRLQDFRRRDLGQPIQDRTVVRATLMRATLHLFTAEDYVRFRTTLAPMLDHASGSTARRRRTQFSVEKLLDAATRHIAEKPRTFAEVTKMVKEFAPGEDFGVMRYTVRTHLPLVQVPVNRTWGYSNKPEFTLAERWIGRPTSQEDNLKELVRRYLAAFGPASATDMQTWSGLQKLKDTFEELRPELQVYRDERGRELFDLPGTDLPAGDSPAPARFLPEYDNLLLSHRDRTRVLANEYRPRVFLPGLRVRATILIDGFVRGAWKIEKTKNLAALVIEPFEKLSKQDRVVLTGEAESLIRFIEQDAKSFEVRFAEPV
jgi:hypothetical protein